MDGWEAWDGMGFDGTIPPSLFSDLFEVISAVLSLIWRTVCETDMMRAWWSLGAYAGTDQLDAYTYRIYGWPS